MRDRYLFERFTDHSVSQLLIEPHHHRACVEHHLLESQFARDAFGFANELAAYPTTLFRFTYRDLPHLDLAVLARRQHEARDKFFVAIGCQMIVTGLGVELCRIED